jgi:hypothetical protein
MAVARRLGRNCLGCEKILKLGVELKALVREDMVEVTVRECETLWELELLRKEIKRAES